MRILVSREGQQFGPYTLDEARAAVQSGTVRETDLAWLEGTPSWVPLSTLLPGPAPAVPPGLPPGGFPAPYSSQPLEISSGLAVWSLILGILSMFCGSIFTGIPAIICGHLARGRAREQPARYGGAGMALGGLIMGYIAITLVPVFILLSLAVPAFTGALRKGQEAQAVSNARLIASACMQYAAAHEGRYPQALPQLVPEYLPNAKALTSPLLQPPQAVAFDYLEAGRAQPAGEEILLMSKWKDRRGNRVVAHVDGSASIVKDEVLPAPPPR